MTPLVRSKIVSVSNVLVYMYIIICHKLNSYCLNQLFKKANYFEKITSEHDVGTLLYIKYYKTDLITCLELLLFCKEDVLI